MMVMSNVVSTTCPECATDPMESTQHDFHDPWKVRGAHSTSGIGLDPVNSPAHYNIGSIECIEAIRASMSYDEFLGYLKGNTIKYLWRYRYKGKGKQDLAKAQWYLNRLNEEFIK